MSYFRARIRATILYILLIRLYYCTSTVLFNTYCLTHDSRLTADDSCNCTSSWLMCTIRGCVVNLRALVNGKVLWSIERRGNCGGGCDLTLPGIVRIDFRVIALL